MLSKENIERVATLVSRGNEELLVGVLPFEDIVDNIVDS